MPIPGSVVAPPHPGSAESVFGKDDSSSTIPIPVGVSALSTSRSEQVESAHEKKLCFPEGTSALTADAKTVLNKKQSKYFRDADKATRLNG
jgi:hypothetical protein